MARFVRTFLIVAVALAIGSHAAAPATFAWEHWPGEWSPNRPSLVQPSTSPARWIDAAVFRLEVPFRSQKDGGPWQISNCGPATLGMVLDGFGRGGVSTDDLRFRSHTYQGTVGRRTGTALDHIARVADDLGLRSTGLFNSDGGYNAWTLDDIRGQLRQGHPVMPLVRLYQMPGYENIGTRWGHYILLTGVAPGGFYYSDSLQTDALAGRSGWISEAQLQRAIATSHIPGQAVAFAAPELTELAVWTLE